MKKILTLIVFVYINLFAATNVLIKNSQPIIDIGTNNSISRSAAEYNKIDTYIPALLKNIDHNIDISERLQEKANCEMDNYGNEGCTIDEVSCDSSNEYANNISKQHNGRVTIGSNSVTVPESLVTNTVWSALGLNKNKTSHSKIVEYDIYPGGYLSVKNYSGNACDNDSQSAKIMVNGVVKMKAQCKTFVVDEYDQFSGTYVLAAGYYNIEDTGFVKIYENYTTEIQHIKVSYNVYYSGKHHDHSTMYERIYTPAYTDYKCILGYYLLNNETCAKDYVYYTYTCPTDIDEHGQKWNGPMVNTGGDCQGVGIPEKKGGVCPGQTSSGFNRNCIRTKHNCPFGEDISCVAKSASDNYINNAFEGKIYKIADSIQHNSISSLTLKCPNINEDSIENECPPGWDFLSEKNICVTLATDFLDSEDSDYTFLFDSKFYKNKKYASKVDKINNDILYITSPTRGLDYTLNTCVSDKKIECVNKKYTFNSDLNKCIVKPECSTYINGVCYSKPKIKCKEGFIKNEVSNKCEAPTNCIGKKYLNNNNGVIENICISNDNIYCPITTMQFNNLYTNMCATKFLIKSPECNDGFNLLSGVCLKELNSKTFLFSNLLERGVAVKWSFNNSFDTATLQDAYWKFDKNGTIGSRIAENSGESFLLDKNIKNGYFGIFGNVKESIADNNSSLGIVFGYKNINDFYAFRVKEKNNNGLYLSQLIKASLLNGKRKDIVLKESFTTISNPSDFKIGLTYKNGFIKGYLNENETISYENNTSISGKFGLYKKSNGENKIDIEKIYSKRDSLLGDSYSNNSIIVHPNRVYTNKISHSIASNSDYYIPEDLKHYEYKYANIYNYSFGMSEYYINYNVSTVKSEKHEVKHDYMIFPVKIKKDGYYKLRVDTSLKTDVEISNVKLFFAGQGTGYIFHLDNKEASLFLKAGTYPLKIKLVYDMGEQKSKMFISAFLSDINTGEVVWNTLTGDSENKKRIPRIVTDLCYVNGVRIFQAQIETCDKYKADFPNDIPYYMKLDLLDLSSTTEELICPEGYLEVENSDQCYKDTEYYEYNRNTIFSNFKLFDIKEESAFCDTGYLMNEDKFLCYEDFNLTKSHYDFDTKIVNTIPSCKEGVFDITLNTCVTEQTCEEGIKYTDNNGNDSCQINPEFDCGSNEDQEYVDNNDTHNLFLTDTEFLIGACKINQLCTNEDTQINLNGTVYCSNDNTKEVCPEGYSSLAGFNVCAALPTCKEGYVRNGNECIIHYSWYEYTCSNDWSGPNELFRLGSYKAGGDCHGQCGADYCNCNSPVAPANSCSKPFDMNNLIHYVAERKPLIKHNITGDTLGASEMNLLRDFKCSDNSNDCLGGLNKVSGDNSDLCFERKNGERKCLHVDGCYFNGSLDNGNLITGLKLLDPYTLVSSNGYETIKINESYIVSDSASKKMEICADSSATMKAFTDSGKLIVRITPGRHNCGGTGYYDFIKRDLKGVIPSDINISYIGGCLGKGDSETLKTTLSVNGSAVTMYGKCSLSGAQRPTVDLHMSYNASVPKFTCPEHYVDPQNNDSTNGYCFKNFEDNYNQKLISSCKMNGHVGWENRTGPITSVGNEVSIGNIVDMNVNGSVDMNDGTKWDNFNAATIALKFSDDNWYVISNVTDKIGNAVNIDLPSGVKLLANKNYDISGLSNVCKYENIDLDPNLCGTNIKIKTPGTQLYLKEITDIKSLRTIMNEPVNTNNDINLSFKFYNETHEVHKSGIWNPSLKILADSTKTDIDNDFNNVNNRIRFWDSYEDGYVGFIEFVNEVNYNDREAGFVPEFFNYEELLGKGFTSIFLLSDKDAYLNSEDIKSYSLTYAVRERPTSKNSCLNFAHKFNGNVVNMNDFNIPEKEDLIKSMGMKDRFVCVISLPGIKIPNNSKFAIKVKSFSGNVEYKCSPYTCKDSQCIKASCKESFEGDILPDYFLPMNNECIDQDCDGNKDFVEVCGKEGSCPDKENVVTEEDNSCKELYCEEGYFDMITKKCIVKKCPPTTIIQNGVCVAK